MKVVGTNTLPGGNYNDIDDDANSAILRIKDDPLFDLNVALKAWSGKKCYLDFQTKKDFKLL
jgi:hypothetical protein